MKNYLILFGLLFSIFIIPSDVLAAGEDLYIPYYNLVNDYDVKNGEGESLKNLLYSKLSTEQKQDGDKCLLYLYKEQYYLICTSSFTDSIRFSYVSSKNTFLYIFSTPTFRIYRFDNSYNFLDETSDTSLLMSDNSFENVILYSDLLFSFYANGIKNIYFYDINDFSKIYGQFNTIDNYSYNDLYLTEFCEDIVVFQDNDFHSISKLILGDNIPEEFSFVYTISDYLLCLILVGIIISPVAIIIKVMRW